MDILLTVLLVILGILFLGFLCLVAFCCPSPGQYSLGQRVLNKHTGKPLSNSNVKLPLGDLAAGLKDFINEEKRKLKFIPEGAIGWWALNKFDVQLTNADWLKEMLHMPDIKFGRSLESFKTLYRMMGTSLLGCQGEAWARMHKILYKAFNPAQLVHYNPVFVRHARVLADSLDAAAATNSPLEMLNAFNDLTLGVMVDAGFGNSIDPDDRKLLLHAFHHTLKATQNPLHDIPILCSLPFPANLELERQFKIVHTVSERIIERRRAMHASGEYSESHDGKYVVDMLLEAHETGGQLSDIELRDNVLMMLIAGSETTGTTLTWALWHIMSVPSVYEKVLAEVDKLDLTWEHFGISNLDADMPYLTMVLHESLRVMPAVSGIPERIFTEDMEIGDLILPKGSRVGVSIWVMHHNPDYWHDTDKFVPERFSEEDTKNRHRFAYLPFGLGRRQCMGRQFALNEVRIVLALLIKSYTFKYDESNGPVSVNWRIPTLTPRNGLPVFATRR